ncbi:MAG: MFS transporter, partial [Acidobacteriota bacterium]
MSEPFNPQFGAAPASTVTTPPPAVFRLMAFSVGTVVANLYYAQPLLPDIAREFHLSVTQAGAFAMLSMAGAGVGQLIFVPFGDIRERRKLIVSMIVAAGIAVVLMATAQNAAWLMLATLLIGITATVNHVTTPYAAHLAPP